MRRPMAGELLSHASGANRKMRGRSLASCCWREPSILVRDLLAKIPHEVVVVLSQVVQDRPDLLMARVFSTAPCENPSPGSSQSKKDVWVF
jgi:hypothetical protein